VKEDVTKSDHGQFFGINAAVSYLVMACGTLRD
jgi:hypothetical protein